MEDSKSWREGQLDRRIVPSERLSVRPSNMVLATYVGHFGAILKSVVVQIS